MFTVNATSFLPFIEHRIYPDKYRHQKVCFFNGVRKTANRGKIVSMIISASRRTDIPAYYADWFFDRIAKGFVLVRNPMNPRQISRVALDPESVDCFVFWSKYPEKFMEKLHLLHDYRFYFQFTLTPYGPEIEKNIPCKSRILDLFKKLAEKIGPEKMIWRYDPILLNNDKYSIDYHREQFAILCKELEKCARKCVISFFDNYRSVARNTKELNLRRIEPGYMKQIGFSFAQIASSHKLRLETCAEAIDLSEFGIEHGRCIDDRIISELTGHSIKIARDSSQRELCGCVRSVDIGSYSTCPGNCLYCYATKNFAEARRRFATHDSSAPLLYGELTDHDKIYTRKNESLKIRQPKLHI